MFIVPSSRCLPKALLFCKEAKQLGQLSAGFAVLPLHEPFAKAFSRYPISFGGGLDVDGQGESWVGMSQAHLGVASRCKEKLQAKACRAMRELSTRASRSHLSSLSRSVLRF